MFEKIYFTVLNSTFNMLSHPFSMELPTVYHKKEKKRSIKKYKNGSQTQKQQAMNLLLLRFLSGAKKGHNPKHQCDALRFVDLSYFLRRLPALLLQPALLFFCLRHMPHGGYGMVKQHARTGKAHHFFDLFAHLRLIAMHRTVGAKGLCFHERTAVGALMGVGFQCAALVAQLALRRFVLLSAIERDHIGHHVLFPLTFVFKCGVHQLSLPFSTA